jgi:tRNA (guanine37-N1)-methyltransferase
MKIDIVTLFPEMFSALDYGIVGRAKKNAKISVAYWNPRDFTDDKTGRVDDRPYGGGPGMVMQVQPLRDTLKKIKETNKGKIIYLSPQGKLLDQSALKYFATQKELVLISGRYEGIDERIIEHDVDEEWSIGDYVLSGGELAAMVMIDGVTRLLPDVLGDAESASQDSFSEALLDYPHYTRPEEIDGQCVPDVLLSGNHQAILKWRKEQALLKTTIKRPDLLKRSS